ncbi:hypothetical protein [uncultured Roseovarius sp.]|jgi:hypothetical protein|uniref:hypothetical protein n=1 Tax=uncultured Roseovarius sp. TaxID=293344 RepID=UPI00261967BA|nr:hypothetical protein [uncultured Roseovarius sp.]
MTLAIILIGMPLTISAFAMKEGKAGFASFMVMIALMNGIYLWTKGPDLGTGSSVGGDECWTEWDGRSNRTVCR